MYYNVALTTTITNTLLLVWSHCKLFLQARKARLSYRDSHLFKCLILKASFVSEFSRTGQGYKGMSSGHTALLYTIYYSTVGVLSSKLLFFNNVSVS